MLQKNVKIIFFRPFNVPSNCNDFNITGTLKKEGTRVQARG